MKINLNQKEYYGAIERNSIDFYAKKYQVYLEQFKEKKDLKILDIGGASGMFASYLSDVFKDNNCEVYVLDSTKYEEWEDSERNVRYIEDTVENLSQHFQKSSFDIIFMNRVVHHLVYNSWTKTHIMMAELLKDISGILKSDGRLFICDHFYNGFIFDNAPSFLIYKLTSCKIPFIVKLCKAFKAESAGVGVCFLSQKNWDRLLNKADLTIENAIFGSKGIKKIQHYLLFIGSYSYDNVMMLKSHLSPQGSPKVAPRFPQGSPENVEGKFYN